MSAQQEAKIVVSGQDATGSVFSGIIGKISGVTSSLDAMRSRLSGALPTGHLQSFNSGLGSLHGKLAALGVISGGVALGGVAAIKSGFDSIVATAEKMDRISDLGGRLHLNAEEFQVFDKVAKASGSSVEEAGASFLKFKEKLGSARSSGGEDLDQMTKLLGRFGIAKDQVINGKAIDLLKMIGNATAAANGIDGVKKSADELDLQKITAYKDVFGKAGAQQIATFEEIAKSYDKTVAGMREAGMLVTDEMARQGGDAFKSYEKSKGAMSGLKIAFGIEMMPLFDQFSRIMNDRMKANREAMLPGVRKLAEVLTTQIEPFLDDMDSAAVKLSGIFKIMSKVAGLVGWDKLVFGGLALIAAPFILSAGTVAVAAWGATTSILGMMASASVAPAFAGLIALKGFLVAIGFSAAGAWAALLGPIAIGGLLIAGIATMIYQNWGGISAFFDGIWDGLKSGLSPVSDAFGVMWDSVSEIFTGILKMFGLVSEGAEIGTDAWKTWGDAGKSAGEAIASIFKFLISPLALLHDGVQKLVQEFKKLKGEDYQYQSAVGRLFAPDISKDTSMAGDVARLNRQSTLNVPVARQEFSGRLAIEVHGNAEIKNQTASNGFELNTRVGPMFGV